MRVRVLGPLEVAGDRAALLGGPTQRAIVAVLVLARNRAVSADRLLDVVWRGEAPASGVRTLRSNVSRLRAALEDAHATTIEAVPGGHVLRVEPEELDLGRAEALAQQARDETDPSAAAALLTRALDEWKGSPLAEFADLPELAAEGRRLDELRWTLLERRIALALEAGDHGTVVGELETLVVEQPLREPLWEHLGLALYRSGRQGDALRTFQRARAAMAEAGLEPGPSMRALDEAVAVRSPSIDRASAAIGPAPPTELRPEDGAAIPLRGSRVTIGADVRNDVVLEDPSVSRAHAVLQWMGPAWIVRDLGSRNGTYVNSRPLRAEQALRNGDELTLGQTRLRLHVRGEQGSRVTAVLHPPVLAPAQRRLLAALCRPLLEGDVLSTPATVEEVAADLGDSVDGIARALGEVATLFDLVPGPPWDPLARAAVARGSLSAVPGAVGG